MPRPPLAVADIFRRYGEAYRQAHEGSLSAAHRRVMRAIETCRTAALSGHVERGEHCDASPDPGRQGVDAADQAGENREEGQHLGEVEHAHRQLDLLAEPPRSDEA